MFRIWVWEGCHGENGVEMVNLAELSGEGERQCGQSVLPTPRDCIETTTDHFLVLPVRYVCFRGSTFDFYGEGRPRS